MVEISRDGKRVHWMIRSTRRGMTNSILKGIPGAEVMANANPNGGLELTKGLLGEVCRRIPGTSDLNLTVVIVRRICSAIRRFEFERSRLDTCLALDGYRCEWPLPWGRDPGMGWPLAVSAGLIERSSRALMAALWPLAVGHLLAMLLVMLPFALLVALVEWQRQIQIGASFLVIGFGIFRLVDRRHPHALSRIRPTKLGLWSFAAAIAHGAGLMLVPIYLGLCREVHLDTGHEAPGTLMNANLGMAVLIFIVHATAMIVAGGCSAWLVYRYFGPKFISRSWFNQTHPGPLASFWSAPLHQRSAD